MEIIHSDHAPAALGPYSQAIRTGGLVFCSGQLGLDPATGKLAGATVEEQAEQACRNVESVLIAAGLSLTDVVKTTCFLADMGDFAAFNAVYAKYFVSKPARSCFAVKALPSGGLCEIEAVAAVPLDD